MKSSLLKTLLAAAMLSGASAAGMAKVETLSGEATYYDNGEHSRVECMRLAAEEARIEALRSRFGTIVGQDINQQERLSAGKDQADFLSTTFSEVRGQWLGDEGEPEYDISLDKDGNFVVKCKVKGKASPVSNEAPEFQALVLRNSPDKQAAETSFRHGDMMYLYFNGSENGYLSVFLEDESRHVYQLLPYISDSRSRVQVKRNNEYIFFSRDKNSEPATVVDEFRLTAPERLEFNRVYVVYSPSEYSAPAMSMNSGGLSSTSSAEFTKWLSRARRGDSKMGVKAMNISIQPAP